MKDKNSMLFWYPKIRYLGISQPKTEFVLLSIKEFRQTMDGMPKSITNRVKNIIEAKFKLPIFIRTDLASGKHFWKDACYYDGTKDLARHLFSICEANHCADIMGLSFEAIVIREYIPMASKYTTFYGEMPVNPERRYFVKEGEVLCHHPYWIEEAIRHPSVKNWRELSKEMNIETPTEIELLTRYAQEVSLKVKGCWSVDFCLAKDGRWILIDMALAKGDGISRGSWHPKDCNKLEANR